MILLELSVIVLFVMVIGLGLAIWALSRQVGEYLKEITSPMTPIYSGPALRSPLSTLMADLGFETNIGDEEFKVLLILSAGCVACKTLAESLPIIGNDFDLSSLRILAMADGDDHPLIAILRSGSIPLKRIAPSQKSEIGNLREFPAVLLLDHNNLVVAKYIASVRSLTSLLESPRQYMAG